MDQIDVFVKNHDGELIKNGGKQCVAVFNQYSSEVVGAGWIGTPITGYANDIWTEFGKDSDYQYYNRISASDKAQKGDIAIWSKYPSYSNLPHIALVLEDQGENIKCFTQNPKPAHVEVLTKSGLLGYMRPKKFVNSQPIVSNPSQPVGLYVVKTKINGYVSSSDAANRVNSNSFVQPGSYAIFNTSNNMINITNTAGVPGWWINPSDNVDQPVTNPTPVQEVANTSNGEENGMFVIRHEVPGYVNSADAMNGSNSNSTVPCGTYSIFNKWNGAVNITRQAGVPGWWINPNK